MKACPFCAEQIQEQAIKCRFCGSMLDGSVPATGRAAPPGVGPPGTASPGPARILYEGTPSWKGWFFSYILACTLSIVVVGLPWLIALQLKRRNTRYRITDRAIDYETGLFSKKIETLQMWRVKDIDFHQSLFERMLGIARIHVITSDRTDPDLILRGLPASRDVFEKLKDAAELARQQRVVGLVE